MEIVGNIVVVIGTILTAFGVIGLFRFNDFYSRILVSAKIDTVGVITIIIGIAIKHGFGFFTLKLVLIMLLVLILNPLAAHIIARSAYSSEGGLDDELEDDGRGGA